ncbi:E3 ubiquitin-protein ligase arc-1 isoform X1 [Bombina bombina]|uniref:E3 ubiquitin-protein ligase arc-1 isoform X1 n=1 Tax=Bombina bombina TaxID=8345 RepID=UPI00235B0A38|nr:E3 ubiquitin-protein ligase arc-1 isoform X1 [Bombina bombina]
MSGLRSFGLAAAVLAASGGVALAAWKYLSAREQKLNSKQNSDSRESEELPVELNTSANLTTERLLIEEDKPTSSQIVYIETSRESAAEMEERVEKGTLIEDKLTSSQTVYSETSRASSTEREECVKERILIEDNIASNQTVYTEKSRESAAEKQERVEEGTVSDKPFKQVLVLGLDGSGKTSVLHSIVTNRGKRSTEPTGGFNAMSITTHHSKMEFLEIGGSEQLRPYWKMYLPKALAVIYVVDSADHNRLPLAKMHLHQLIQQDSILPLVVLANKQVLNWVGGWSSWKCNYFLLTIEVILWVTYVIQNMDDNKKMFCL